METGEPARRRFDVSTVHMTFIAGAAASVAAISLAIQTNAGDSAFYMTAGAAYCVLAITTLQSAIRSIARPHTPQ